MKKVSIVLPCTIGNQNIDTDLTIYWMYCAAWKYAASGLLRMNS